MVLCVVASVEYLAMGGSELLLSWGDGYHPLQWVTSIFDHLGIVHLAFNLIALSCFGLIGEGKIGWWRFFWRLT